MRSGQAGLLLGWLTQLQREMPGCCGQSAMFINAGIPKCYNSKHHERRVDAGEIMIFSTKKTSRSSEMSFKCLNNREPLGRVSSVITSHSRPVLMDLSPGLETRDLYFVSGQASAQVTALCLQSGV